MANQIRPFSMCLLLNILFVSKADSEITNQLQFLHQMILRVEQIKKKMEKISRYFYMYVVTNVP